MSNVDHALALAKSYAGGGDVSVPYYAQREAAGDLHTGPLISAVPGRTDKLPISVPPNSYVLPADVVSGLPGAEGNTLAGHKILNSMFNAGPYGRGAFPGAGHRARGGRTGNGAVPIIAAGGEYVVPPEIVESLGGGDMKHGHEVLDAFVRNVRDQHIKTLKKLPGPVKK